MTKKNILFCIMLFVLSALASTYYYLEMPFKVMANTRYIIIPFFAFRIVFPILWGIILFVLIYSLRAAEKSNRTARMIIEAVFFIANVASVFISFYELFTFSSYTLTLTGLLCAGIIFEINQKFKSKRSAGSEI